MPATLVDTAGSATANTYVSRSDADSIIDDRLNASAWSSATDENKDRALIMATAAIDRIEWNPDRVGTRKTETQALRFPALGVINRFGDEFYSETAVPDFVRLATVEAALAFLQTDRKTEPSRDRAIASESVGPLSRSYFRGEITPKDPLAAPVWEIIEYWALSRSSEFNDVSFGPTVAVA